MEAMSLIEIIMAVAMVLTGQKGLEVYKRRKHSNGRHDRRSGSEKGNSFADSDKDFIRGCFEDQTEKLVLGMENDRLILVGELKDFIRSDGESTRVAVRDVR
ncbi:hypothetical protein LCGC14_2000300 [marine sediment metagenome]|uniref:Uncharacterized protein n=1 Tax=marine sediment metagenome TaxID=412755 RepID=A0A0F9F3P4_9ZZZZ